ncbi:hypothetical protein OTU49_015881 [Cherax quadricarinatus]|uniref:Uncharacterized protein n=1 Tax=Cherax quadricarinatus TaxID=27406 RepID=A0AAW0XXR3_CHEQU
MPLDILCEFRISPNISYEPHNKWCQWCVHNCDDYVDLRELTFTKMVDIVCHSAFSVETRGHQPSILQHSLVCLLCACLFANLRSRSRVLANQVKPIFNPTTAGVACWGSKCCLYSRCCLLEQLLLIWAAGVVC